MLHLVLFKISRQQFVSHYYQTVSASVVVCPSLNISIVPIPDTPPDNWRRVIIRPRQSWLRTVEADLQPMNLGLATAKRRAQDRSAWPKLVATSSDTLLKKNLGGTR